MIHFYKPNAKVTGSACSFYLNKKDNAFFSTLIKQESWDSAKRIGSFQKNKKVPSKHVNIKYSPAEIAGFIDAIERNAEVTGYHGSNQIAKFKFSPYVKDGTQKGFSYLVSKESKEDSTQKSSFIIGFTFPELRLLKEHLIFILQESFKITDQKFEESSKKYIAPQKQEATALPEEEEDDLW
tara:strand:+ start:807 stop:1352 length:546 start_codon:yes stop_codon:yes gene_type:complete